MLKLLRLLFAKKKEACPNCGSKNTSSNNAGMWHCWDCDTSWRGEDY